MRVRRYDMLDTPAFDGIGEQMQARALVTVEPSIDALVRLTWYPGDGSVNVEPIGLADDDGEPACDVPAPVLRVIEHWAYYGLDAVMVFDRELAALREERAEEMAS